MTGTVLALTSGTRTGTIRSQDGSRLLFSASNVLGEFESLAIGHRVSFEVDAHSRAVRVFAEPRVGSAIARKTGGPPDLRYTGFTQAQNVRTYRFDAVTSGSPVHHCVTVDVGLLLKHRIGVQEAPSLCLHKLSADLEGSPESGQHVLGDRDLLEFASSRAATAEREAEAQFQRPSRHTTARSGAPITKEKRRGELGRTRKNKLSEETEGTAAGRAETGKGGEKRGAESRQRL